MTLRGAARTVCERERAPSIMPTTRRLPVSSRHAFALAFDLAVRRDWLHSLLVPLALQLPWVVLLLFLPALHGTPVQIVFLVLLRASALLGLWLTGVLISAMLRFRARSVFHTGPLEPIAACYAQGVRRMSALICTEVLRAASLVLGGFLLFLPGLFLGFKFSMATETVVLRGERPQWRGETRALFFVLAIPVVAIPLLTLVPYLMVASRLWLLWLIVGGLEVATILLERDALFGQLLGMGAVPALKRSFLLTEGRWERWLEMIAISVMLIMPIWFLMTLCALLTPGTWSAWFSLGSWLTQASLLVIQYAWTFFYLRLEDSEAAAEGGSNVVVPHAGSGTQSSWRRGNAPQLRLVELARDEPGDTPPGN